MPCAKLGLNLPSRSGEEGENVKSLQTDGQTDRRTSDNRRSEILISAKNIHARENYINTKNKSEIETTSNHRKLKRYSSHTVLQQSNALCQNEKQKKTKNKSKQYIYILLHFQNFTPVGDNSMNLT